MSSSDFDSGDDEIIAKPNGNSKGAKKRLSVERVYQKKTPLEHVLLRPDTYIGSIEFHTQQMWVFDTEQQRIVNREITFVPGLYKIFDEILVNAADNKQRDKKMDTIKIEINPEKNLISVYNNGKGIPVIMHRDEKVYVPTLIFGHLLTSSNYNDEERKVTGGRNGYGAKLCNIFSTKFTVETSCKESGKKFSQTWENNMTKANDYKLSDSKGDDYTKISFHPDLAKFKMDTLDKDFVDLISRRAYDIAGTTGGGVKVYLNGQRIGVKNFKDYIDLYNKEREDDNGQPLKMVYEKVNDRWEIGLTLSSEKGFQQISFVNSIATTKGGTHVDYITTQVTKKLEEAVKKKNKAGVSVKAPQLKNHIWIFVNCLIENPTFDSQTKENMTLQSKSFGSKCAPSDKFFNGAMKVGIVEAILSWVNFKAQSEMGKALTSKKTTKIKNLPKLDDANDAGTKASIDCTLILTEGDSAKSMVVAGLGVVGRDKYGCFPLRGKMLNVREASHKQIMDNAEINNIIKIMGLQYNKKYLNPDDLKSLRYGRLMIMTDQDQDGSHIKGLLINFIHHNWPSLLKLPFLEEFITPIVKVKKGNEKHSFYSLPEFQEWKDGTRDWKSWNVKYYKGLGTSTSEEAKEYFSNLTRNRIKFKYEGPQDDQSIELAFSKKMVEDRKVWLTNSMEDRKRRRELGLPEVYLYERDTKEITYRDFINKELILFSNTDNERSIPSLMDGLKPGQRKVMFTCFKRNDKKEVKVAQLAAAVGEKSAYHHGEVSLQTTIVGLAQDFVGSNNIPFLQPLGQFGTRLQGGKDSASARYIFTMLSPLTRKLFPAEDDPLLNYLWDDNLRIEPEYYVPIIPTVLVNGATGIGTGWSTNIPNYNPRELAENIKRMLKGEEPKEMKPWFKDFRGSIIQIDETRYLTVGEMARLDGNKIEITELPIRVWTQTYKENVLEPYVNGPDKEKEKDKKDKDTEKFVQSIQDYKEYHTDETVRFVVSMTDPQMNKIQNTGFFKHFKLQSSLSTGSMVLFDYNGVLRKYDSPVAILKEFFEVRKDFYYRRKQYLEGRFEAETGKLSNQARFIMENIEEDFKLVKLKEPQLIKELIARAYDPDPEKEWMKRNQAKYTAEEIDDDSGDVDNGRDFNYLLNMNIRQLLPDHAEKLLKKRDDKQKELNQLRATRPETFWLRDLDAFLEELDKYDQSKQEQIEKGHAQLKGKFKGKKKVSASEETKPSVFGERIEPDLEEEIAKKTAGKIKKEKKNEVKEEVILDDEDIPLSERIGTSPELINKNKKASAAASTNDKPLKQTKLNFKPITKPKEDDVMEVDDSSTQDSEDVTIVEDRNGHHQFDDLNDLMASSSKPVSTNSAPKQDDSIAFDKLFGKKTSTNERNGDAESSTATSSSASIAVVKEKKVKAKEPKKLKEPKEKKKAKEPKEKKEKKKAEPKKKKPSKKRGSDSETEDDDFKIDDDDTEDFVPVIPKERNKRAATEKVKSKYVFSDDEDEDEDDFIVQPSKKKKVVDSDDEDFD